MTLDASPNDHPPLGTVRDIEHDPRDKPKPPGEYRLRIVTTLMIIAAALTSWQFLGALFSGTIDIGGLIMAPLAVCSAVGLYKRSDSGRTTGIIFLWISLVLKAIALLLLLVLVVGTTTGLMESQEPIGWSIAFIIAYQLVLIAITWWMLTTLKSAEVIALMKRELPLNTYRPRR